MKDHRVASSNCFVVWATMRKSGEPEKKLEFIDIEGG